MKKAALITALAVVITALFPLAARAWEDDMTESIADSAQTDALRNENLSADELSGEKSINIFEKLLQIVSGTLSGARGTLLGSFGKLFAAIVFCCLMGAIRFSSDGAEQASGYITLLVTSAAAYSLMYDLFVFVTAAMEALQIAMSSLLPVTASLYVMGGNPAASAASGSAMLIFLTVLQTVCAKVLLPLLRVTFALSVAGSIPGGSDLSSLTALLKTTATTVLAFLFTMLGFTLYMNASVAAASDTYFTRSVKFASGVFVPVIGNILGDAFRTVAASVSTVKGVVGAAGTTMILSAVVPPLVVVTLYRVVIALCAAAAKAFGCENEGRFLSSLSGVAGVLTALTAGAGAVSLISMAVFVNTVGGN